MSILNMITMCAMLVACIVMFLRQQHKGKHIMTPEARQKVKGLLVQDEQYKQFPYIDTTGHITIGVGRNLTDRGISTTEAFYLLDDDIMYFYNKLLHFLPFFTHLTENRQIALIDMCFNLGVQGLLNFNNMIAALDMGWWDQAANEMLKSKWSEQVGERATRLANIIRTGEI